MKIKNVVQKTVKVLAGVSLVGATLSGAISQGLDEYPGQFIQEGVFDGMIVLGSQAEATDLLGAIDIAASLQSESVTVEQVETSSGVMIDGEGYKISTGSDGLEIREEAGKVVDTISESQLPGLKSGEISTSEGSTEYHQYLRVKDGSLLQEFAVNFIENDNDKLSDFLVIDTDKPFMAWEVQFPEGLESSISGGILDDLEGESFNILGQEYTIVQATVDTNGDNFEMTLMSGSVTDTLREGEVRTYDIDGVEYEVAILFVSDPESGGPAEVKIGVNGELTQALEEGETDTLSGGVVIGVQDILVNGREGVVSFFLGADKLEIEDGDTDEVDDFDGRIEINNQNINDGEVTVLGQVVGNNFELTSMKYQLEMDSEDGGTAYVPAGEGIRAFMERPESLISDSFDLFYAGLNSVETREVGLRAQGDDEYVLSFTNVQGSEYEVPLFVERSGSLFFGSDDETTHVFEAPDSNTYVIERKDSFFVSNDRGVSDADKSVTNALEYTDYDDSDFTLEFEDLSSGNSVHVPVDTSDEGSLVIGGHTYTVSVEDRTMKNPRLAIDLNADGDVDSDKVTITSWGGVVLDPNTGNTSDEVNMSLTELSKNFDTSNNGNGLFEWKVTSDSEGVDLGSISYDGPLSGGDEWNEFDLVELDHNDDVSLGLSDWGINIRLVESDDSDDPDELFFEVPSEQVFANVFVTLEEGVTTSSNGVESAIVNPIGVGMAVLDSEVSGLGVENMIVVGGPCVNSVAADLLGNKGECSEGFEEGKAVIRSWTLNDKVAILVAGHSALDTLSAARVLADYQSYDLVGSEVEVVALDFESVQVNTIV